RTGEYDESHIPGAGDIEIPHHFPTRRSSDLIQSAIDETAKYPVKDTDFMTDDEEKNLKRLSDLEEGLHRKRLISYGGLLKEIHKKLNLDDTEEGDLIHTDDD